MIFELALKDGSLSQSDLAVIDFISRNAEAVTSMTSRELAEAAFVSQPTVIRLCKKAGFSGFTDMKLALAREQADETSYQRVNPDFPFLANESDGQVIRRISSMERQAIRRTEQLLSGVSWAPIIRALAACESVSLYGLAFSACSLGSFRQEMLGLGKPCQLFDSESDMLRWAASCNQGDFAIFASYSGSTSSLLPAAHILRDRGIKSLCITSNPESPLANLTTWCIPIAQTEHETITNRVSHVQSVASLDYALDTFYALFFNREYARNAGMLSRAADHIHRHRS